MVQELDDTSLLDPDDDVVRVDGEDEVDGGELDSRQLGC